MSAAEKYTTLESWRPFFHFNESQNDAWKWSERNWDAKNNWGETRIIVYGLDYTHLKGYVESGIAIKFLFPCAECTKAAIISSYVENEDLFGKE